MVCVASRAFGIGCRVAVLPLGSEVGVFELTQTSYLGSRAPLKIPRSHPIVEQGTILGVRLSPRGLGALKWIQDFGREDS